MKLTDINIKIILTLMLSIMLALFLVIITDWGVSTIISKGRVVKLKNQAEADIFSQQKRFQELKVQVNEFSQKITDLQQLKYPTLLDLKKSASSYHLELYNVEKGNQKSDKHSEITSYTTTFLGKATSIVKFLRRLEIDFLLNIDQLTVRPTNEAGEQVALTMLVYVSE